MRQLFLTLTVSLCLLSVTTFGQTDSSKVVTKDMLIGKWDRYVTNELKTDFKQSKRWHYEFFKDGHYKENVQPNYGSGKKPFVEGKWTLIGNVLTMTEKKYTSEVTIDPTIETVTYYDNNTFYSTGYEGKRKLFVVFIRRQ